MLKITQKLLEMLLIRGLPFTEEKEFGAFEAAELNSVITFTEPVHKDGVTTACQPKWPIAILGGCFSKIWDILVVLQ